MSTIAEIEDALRTLPVKDAATVAGWLQRYLDEHWDQQIDDDIAAGRLDRIAERSLHAYQAARVKPLDEVIDQP